jgi:Serine hydrolase (FSH1)
MCADACYAMLYAVCAYWYRVWREHGPFDGIMGFAQGAAMASMFTHHLVTLHSGATAAATTTAAAAETTTDTDSSSSTTAGATTDNDSSSSDAPPAAVTALTAVNGSTPRHSVKVWVDVGESTSSAATAAAAAVATLLQPPQFALFAAGYVYPYPANWPSYPPVSECGERGIVQCSVPSFHYWGVDDSIVPVGESQILAALYRRPTICMRRSVLMLSS